MLYEVITEVVSGIRERGGAADAIMADVSKHDEVERLVTRTVDTFGSLDIVVSNVGIRRMQAFLEISVDDWETVIRTNLSAAFYLARNAIPHMQKKKSGRFIVVSGFDGFWGQVTHRAHRITSYNVCYTKLLRPQKPSKPDTTMKRPDFFFCMCGMALRAR